MADEKSQAEREENKKLLDSYDGGDIFRPQVVLRKVHKIDDSVLNDDLYKTTVDVYGSMEDIPEEFTWAEDSLHNFRRQYRKMLEEPTERVHLEALVQNGCRLFIEDLWSLSYGNTKNGLYGGMSTNIMGKPAICMVADKFDDETLLQKHCIIQICT